MQFPDPGLFGTQQKRTRLRGLHSKKRGTSIPTRKNKQETRIQGQKVERGGEGPAKKRRFSLANTKGIVYTKEGNTGKGDPDPKIGVGGGTPGVQKKKKREQMRGKNVREGFWRKETRFRKRRGHQKGVPEQLCKVRTNNENLLGKGKGDHKGNQF